MSDLSWREELHTRLVRAGLPREYVTRILGELDDHDADLVDEFRRTNLPAAGDRIGDARRLAEVIVTQYRARRIAGRHPFLFFILLPPLLVTTLWLLSAMLAATIVTWLQLRIPSDVPFLDRCLEAAIVVPPFSIVSFLLYQTAQRCGRRPFWPALALGIVSLLAVGLHLSSHFQGETGPHAFVLSVGPAFSWAVLAPLLALSGLLARTHLSARVATGLMLSCVLTAAAPQAGANELLPRRRLFPDFEGQVFRGSVMLSPNGERLAYLVLRASSTGLKEASVATRSVEKTDERLCDATTANAPIRSLQWAFNSRHVVYERQRSASPGADVYCLDVGTGKVTRLLPDVKASSTIAALSPMAPDDVILAADNRAAGSPDLYRVDLRTGESRVVFRNPGFHRLLLDDSFEARIGIKARDDGHAEVIAIIPKGENRTLLSADALLTPLSNHAQLVGFGKSGRDAYFLSNYHRDTVGLINCDLETGTRKLVFETKYADVANVLFDSNRGCVLACSYEYDRTRWSAIEPSMEPHLTYLQSLEDGNLSVRSRSLTGEIWIASYAMLDTSTRYYAYDTRKKAARFLFASGSAFDGLPLAKMHSVVINSRDRLPLTGYLTLPPGIKMKDDTHPAAAAPMVLLVHGGPYGRDEWGFHGEHQLLANRGYVVLGVNFRGSEGFGRQFLEAADREWGGKVIDDVTDAADWAIQEGIADPKRIALMGSSFGGYAALMSLARYPDKFCCAIDRAGPCDLERFAKESATQSPVYAATRIGDPTTKMGLQQLRDWSPIRQVGRLNRPILVFQGGRESKVQLEEKSSLVRQLRDRKVAATYVEFPKEAHSFQRRDTRLAYYAVIESFLAGHLGGRFEPFRGDVARPVVGECVGESEIAGLAQALRKP